MGTGAITGYVDVAQIVLYLFWAFFFGLIVYLVRENKREGYPLETSDGPIDGWPPRPRPKTYLLEGGHTVHKPDDVVSPQTLNAAPTHRFNGAPLEPTGDPLLAGVGPGAWADRADVTEKTIDGDPKLVPLRAAPGYEVSLRDRDPRGLAAIGADGETGGTVVDLWLDKSEMTVRYFEVAVPMAGGATRNVLLPVNFAKAGADGVHVHAIHGEQFRRVPGTRDPQQVTMLEEEKIMAYYGAGMLYADAERAEPLF
jgi:photosynthetic reaction center H subunit